MCLAASTRKPETAPQAFERHGKLLGANGAKQIKNAFKSYTQERIAVTDQLVQVAGQLDTDRVLFGAKILQSGQHRHPGGLWLELGLDPQQQDVVVRSEPRPGAQPE